MAIQVKLGQVWEIRSRTGATTATVTVVNGEHITMKYDHMVEWFTVDVPLLLSHPDKYRLVTDA